MFHRIACRLIVCLTLLLGSSAILAADKGQILIEDVFGRSLAKQGITLVDWEGHMANPAIKLYVTPPANAKFPARLHITSKAVRLQFGMPSFIGKNGPYKVVTFKKRERQAIWVSIYPDRDTKDESYSIRFDLRDGKEKQTVSEVPCRVIDQDKAQPTRFPLIMDFTEDQTKFFRDKKKQRIVSQAVLDWMEFFEPIPLDRVPARFERVYIFSVESFDRGHYIVNKKAYTGFLMYAYGVRTPAKRAGGEATRVGGFMSSRGKKLSIRRSGSVMFDTRGNYSEKGWIVSLNENEYWKATSYANERHDLYSIAHHEVGHALIFHDGIPTYQKMKQQGKFLNPTVNKYLGLAPAINANLHFRGTIDTASRRGAFGNEYYGKMPLCRWLVTKGDLLCAQAIGWPLRKTSCFEPPSIVTQKVPHLKLGGKVNLRLEARGGIPFYHWSAAGLPPGVRLDSFSGKLDGSAKKAGTFDVKVRLRDYHEKGEAVKQTLRVVVSR